MEYEELVPTGAKSTFVTCEKNTHLSLNLYIHESMENRKYKFKYLYFCLNIRNKSAFLFTNNIYLPFEI